MAQSSIFEWRQDRSQRKHPKRQRSDGHGGAVWSFSRSSEVEISGLVEVTHSEADYNVLRLIPMSELPRKAWEGVYVRPDREVSKPGLG
jgi:hypothetical protein